MARKDLLKGLMAPPPAPAGETAAAKRPARPAKGAIGAVSQSIADLRTRAITEVPADMIDGAGLRDRLGDDGDDGLDRLAQSLADYGQQVPVLLRHSPNYEGRYDVVYGRRRVAALRRLKLPVKAMIRNLSDRDLVIAQGQENSARRDLSFVEKANFARQMAEAGYERKLICDALHVDKTVVSRMLAIAGQVPPALIEAIGPAPGAGRTRWGALAELIAARPDGATGLVQAAEGAGSDRRFEAVLAAARAGQGAGAASPAKARTASKEARTLRSETGAPLALARRGARGLTLDFTGDGAGGFDDWLLRNLARLHADFLKDRS